MIDPGRIYDDLETDERADALPGLVKRRRCIFITIAVILMAVLLIAPCIGYIDIPIQDILTCIFTLDTTSEYGSTVWNIRLVRIVAGLLAGAGLALCGVVMQCILRNPLASPYTLGLSNASAFGAALAIIAAGAGSMATSQIYVDNPYVTTLFAFVFSMIATGVILVLTKATRVSAETMVLAGIAISAIFTALLSLIQYLSTPEQLGNIVSWTFGDLGRATWSLDLFVFAALLLIGAYFMTKRWDYNALDLGEDTAKGLGVNVERERIVGLVLTSFLCSMIVSFFGVIAFIGLLAPHIARMLIGGDHRYLIPASMIIGAAVLIVADLIGKTVIWPYILPVGILTSMLGGPLFIYLLVRRYRQ